MPDYSYLGQQWLDQLEHELPDLRLTTEERRHIAGMFDRCREDTFEAVERQLKMLRR